MDIHRLVRTHSGEECTLCDRSERIHESERGLMKIASRRVLVQSLVCEGEAEITLETLEGRVKIVCGQTSVGKVEWICRRGHNMIK